MYKNMKTSKRTHTCGTLSTKNIGDIVKVTGWVQRRRDLGGLIFVNLRDRSGIIQVVFDKDISEKAFETASDIRNEFVLSIVGKITPREEGQNNENILTGYIEIKAEQLDILNTAQTPPIYIEDEDNISENIRLKYR